MLLFPAVEESILLDKADFGQGDSLYLTLSLWVSPNQCIRPLLSK